jgi:predicted XRE-type DNA-binding protein
MNRETSHESRTYFERGSGNVFADLGLPDPEEALAKAGLAHAIAEAIDRRGLSRAAAARIAGLDEASVNAIVRGRLRAFTQDRLARCLNDLDAASVMSAQADSVRL